MYFVTQNPSDIPDEILGQLGNKVQHALRAFTPKDQKAVKAAAQSFRVNPAIDTETAITELGVGEALVSFLDIDGKPEIVEKAFIVPPKSQIGPLTADERSVVVNSSPVKGAYEKILDRESAYEILKAKAEKFVKTDNKKETVSAKRTADNTGNAVVDAMLKSAARSIGSSVGRQIIRGVLGSILGGR